MNGFQKKIVLKALDNEDLLTDWEFDFVNSLAKGRAEQELSEKQNEILNRISQKLLDR